MADQPDEHLEKALQARSDFHQNILKEYRTRGYQMVLAQAGLAVAAGKYATEGDRSGPEAIAIAAAMGLVTAFLWSWLDRLREKSDGHRDDALALYKRLRVDLPKDSQHAQTRHRLWGPIIWFPVGVFVGLCVWIAGSKLPAVCGMVSRAG